MIFLKVKIKKKIKIFSFKNTAISSMPTKFLEEGNNVMFEKSKKPNIKDRKLFFENNKIEYICK